VLDTLMAAAAGGAAPALRQRLFADLGVLTAPPPPRSPPRLPPVTAPVMLVGASRVRDARSRSWKIDPVKQALAGRRARQRLVVAMAAAVSAVAALAYWDSARESAAALQDFAGEQATLASGLAVAARPRAAGVLPTNDGAELRAGLRSVERPNGLVIFLGRPGDPLLYATDGRRITSDRLARARDRGESVVRIPRDETAALGLAPRLALAGIAHAAGQAGGGWDIVAVASAQHERDREAWARRRLGLSVVTAAGLVLVFGGLAMRNQRSELVLERELAIAGLQQSRDERLQRASKAAVMGTLAMGVAHEIATPLGVIAARAEQMAPRVAHDERLSSGVAAILAQTDRIDQVIRGLLGLARGEAPAHERIDPRATIENAVGLVEHRFAKAGVGLRREVDPALPIVVGDPRLLEHAVVNLLLNACDACRSGGDVVIRGRRAGGEVEILVEDSGAGISLHDVGRALEPFFTTKAREGGTGLGLAIAHEIVTNHRGRLVFSPGEPRGTRAAIRLPPVDAVADV
jgi:signal transduction histidine kinase